MSVTYSNRYRGVKVHYYDGSGNPCHDATINDDVELNDYTTGDAMINETTVCDLIQRDVFLLGVLQTGTVRTAVPFDDTATTNPSFHMPKGECPRS